MRSTSKSANQRLHKFPEHQIKTKFKQHQDLLLQNQLHATGVYIDPLGCRQDAVFSTSTTGNTNNTNSLTFPLLEQLTKEIIGDQQQKPPASSFLVLGDSGFGKT